MGRSTRLRWLVAVAALWMSVGAAAVPAALPVPTPESGLALVQQRKVDAYDEVLAAFDAAMRAAPDDVAVAVARCRFVGQFTEDDYGEWVESAPGEFERCSESLQEERGGAPEAELFALERLWGAERVERGEALLQQADSWSASSRGALLALLSQAHAYQDNDTRAGELAVEAVRLGDHATVASAATWLVSRKRFGEAARMLQDAPPSETPWDAQSRIDTALALPDPRAALEEWQRHAGSGLAVNAAYGARAHLRAGDIAAARRLLEGEDGATHGMAQVRFEVAMAARDYRAAAGTVELTTLDDFQQNLARFAALATTAPATLLIAPSMRLGLLVCGLIIAALLLLPALVLVPAHYRGLVRRSRNKPATPLFQRVGLRHAWYGLAIVFCVPAVVAVLVEPTAGATLLGGESVPEAGALFRVVLWGTLAGLICVLPAYRAWPRHQLIGDRAALFAAWRVLLCWAVLIGVGVLLAFWHGSNGGAAETMQTQTVDALARGASEAYGAGIALLLMALLVPIFEELVYRGLLLGGLSRHIGFGWANLIQASLFALGHDDLPRLPFYLALGLLAGWLVKRTGALGPAIALHMLNNLLAFGVRML